MRTYRFWIDFQQVLFKAKNKDEAFLKVEAFVNKYFPEWDEIEECFPVDISPFALDLDYIGSLPQEGN